MRFSFVGKIDCNEQSAKVPGFRDINSTKKKNGKEITIKGTSMNLVCIAAQNNRAFMECAGFQNDSIQTQDTENNKIQIAWGDREDADIIKKVANYKKNVIVLDGERHEFIATLDFIKFIRDHIDEIKGKEFTVTGQVTKNEYNGKITDRFQIQNMFEVTEEKKHQLKVTGEFIFSADGVDTADWKSEKVINFNGYTQEWMDKDHPKALVAKTLVFNCSKLNLDDEKHVALLNYKLKQMGLSYEDGKIKIGLKKNTYYKQSVILSYVNGAEEVPFDESTLTENQKEAIALGLKKLEDFRPAGAIFGNRVQIYKLTDFDMRGNYEDGAVKLDEKASEIEEMIYTSADKEETEDDFMNPPEEEKKSGKKDDDDISEDDLFD